VYPALAVADWLAIDSPRPPTIRWVGGAGGIEESLIARAGIRFEGISAAKVRGGDPVAILRGLWAQSLGLWQARRLLESFRPDVLLVTGGYVCVPVTLAAWMKRVPILIYLPDVQPGLAIKFLARFADRVAVSVPPALDYFRSGRAVVTGYPVRRELFERGPDRARARLSLGVGSEAFPVLLVFGGSQGARSINQAVSEGVEELLAIAQVMHISGHLDAGWAQARREALPDELRGRYHLVTYLHEEMVDALLAADLVVSRAGASTLGEFPAAGLPAVLVPYPHAGAHQWDNARYLAEAGAAIVIADADLGTALIPSVLELLRDKDRRAAMRRAARALAQPDAAGQVGELLIDLSATGGRGD
jgi:UDP-N-acetylglucosamine--N-acetylmuramyl-(pentapeptide) pyrophosphoryl-undecaprenol N-acetylglucosamine transferase